MRVEYTKKEQSPDPTENHRRGLRCAEHCPGPGLDRRDDVRLPRTLGQEDGPRGTLLRSPRGRLCLLQRGQ